MSCMYNDQSKHSGNSGGWRWAERREKCCFGLTRRWRCRGREWARRPSPAMQCCAASANRQPAASGGGGVRGWRQPRRVVGQTASAREKKWARESASEAVVPCASGPAAETPHLFFFPLHSLHPPLIPPFFFSKKITLCHLFPLILGFHLSPPFSFSPSFLLPTLHLSFIFNPLFANIFHFAHGVRGCFCSPNTCRLSGPPPSITSHGHPSVLQVGARCVCESGQMWRAPTARGLPWDSSRCLGCCRSFSVRLSRGCSKNQTGTMRKDTNICCPLALRLVFISFSYVAFLGCFCSCVFISQIRNVNLKSQINCLSFGL